MQSEVGCSRVGKNSAETHTPDTQLPVPISELHSLTPTVEMSWLPSGSREQIIPCFATLSI